MYQFSTFLTVGAFVPKARKFQNSRLNSRLSKHLLGPDRQLLAALLLDMSRYELLYTSVILNLGIICSSMASQW